MINIYIAGKFSAARRLREEKKKINEKGGFNVLSTWLDVSIAIDEGRIVVTPAVEEQEIHTDLSEIDASDLLILDTFDDSLTGGREFEIGYAHHKGVPFWLVGPRRHIFHKRAALSFEKWDGRIYAALDQEKVRHTL